MTKQHKARIADFFPQASTKVFTLSQYAGVSDEVGDPLPVGTLEAYEACADQLTDCIDAILLKWK